ncbi:uncharacterized protein [Manis javanica]|uniref:uncharacterized protein isoform X2 n=1 Tax=Manis javanica TaxID=9974 RepID=UPI003C6D31D8
MKESVSPTGITPTLQENWNEERKMWYRNIEPKLRAAGCGSLCSASGRNLKSLQVLRPSLVSSPTDPPEHHVRTPTLQENWNEERKMWYRNIEPKLRAAGCGSLCSASGRNLKSLQVLRPSLVSSPTDPPEHHVRTPTLQENWNEERKMWYRNIEPKLRAAGCGSLCSASGRNLKSLQVLRPSLVSSPTDPPEHHVRKVLPTFGRGIWLLSFIGRETKMSTLKSFYVLTSKIF